MPCVNFISKNRLDRPRIDWNDVLSTRAGLLLHLERYQEALIELEDLRQIAPKESLVYYLLSKVGSTKAHTKKPCQIPFSTVDEGSRHLIPSDSRVKQTHTLWNSMNRG